jgi:uncharacterized membrane protein YjgN (DUF898 family)
MNINVLSGVAITLVVVGIVIALGLNIMTDTQSEFVDESVGCNSTYTTGCGHAYNATGDAVEGTAKLSSYLPLIGLVVASVVIIGLLISGFARRR